MKTMKKMYRKTLLQAGIGVAMPIAVTETAAAGSHASDQDLKRIVQTQQHQLD